MHRLTGTIVILFFVFAAKAQFSIGARVGYGAHGIHLEPPSLEKYQTSFLLPNGGLVLAFNNKMNAGLQAEIIYAQKGWKDVDDSIPEYFYSRTINYLEVPFFGHWEIGRGAVRPVILVGPYVAFKLSESADSNNFIHQTEYDQYHQAIRNVSWGIKTGLGLRYNINQRMAIFAEARYDIQVAGGRDIFIDRPNGIQASRLKELSGTFGILWHMIPQQKKEEKEGYVPKENLYEEE
jgi:hypothetical protein